MVNEAPGGANRWCFRARSSPGRHLGPRRHPGPPRLQVSHDDDAEPPVEFPADSSSRRRSTSCTARSSPPPERGGTTGEPGSGYLSHRVPGGGEDLAVQLVDLLRLEESAGIRRVARHPGPPRLQVSHDDDAEPPVESPRILRVAGDLPAAPPDPRRRRNAVGRLAAGEPDLRAVRPPSGSTRRRSRRCRGSSASRRAVRGASWSRTRGLAGGSLFWGAVARKAGIRPLWIDTHREPTAVAASLQHRNGMEPE